MASSWKAIVNPRVLVPAPFVTRWRSLTVAKADSITFVLRMVCQYASEWEVICSIAEKIGIDLRGDNRRTPTWRCCRSPSAGPLR